MNGFINILKPPGMTSAAVVGFLRKATQEKRVGHAGTLDPDAAGVLPVMLGRATRLFDYLVEKEKTYIAECAFGFSTDTQDASGQVIQSGGVYPGLAAITQAAKSLEGEIIQRPSAYSAIKREGVPLYALARAGQDVEAPEREVTIHEIKILREMPNDGVLMQVRCGRGTYIRSVCHDLGMRTGCPAHMRFLLRTATGMFRLTDALTLAQAEAAQASGILADLLIPMDAPLQHLPAIRVPPAYHRHANNGAAIPWAALGVPQGDDPWRVYVAGQFSGIGVLADGMLRWRMAIPLADRQGQAKETGP